MFRPQLKWNMLQRILETLQLGATYFDINIRCSRMPYSVWTQLGATYLIMYHLFTHVVFSVNSAGCSGGRGCTVSLSFASCAAATARCHATFILSANKVKRRFPRCNILCLHIFKKEVSVVCHRAEAEIAIVGVNIDEWADGRNLNSCSDNRLNNTNKKTSALFLLRACQNGLLSRT